VCDEPSLPLLYRGCLVSLGGYSRIHPHTASPLLMTKPPQRGPRRQRGGCGRAPGAPALGLARPVLSFALWASCWVWASVVCELAHVLFSSWASFPSLLIMPFQKRLTCHVSPVSGFCFCNHINFTGTSANMSVKGIYV
jgi:hypothetical protein